MSPNSERPDVATTSADTGFVYVRRAVEPSTVAGMAAATTGGLSTYR
jgi:hypothetical protein